MYYVYIIKSKKTKKLYIGYSADLKNRLLQHNAGISQYTKAFVPWNLVYYESYASKNDAQERERQLKHHAKAYGQLKRRIKNSIHES